MWRCRRSGEAEPGTFGSTSCVRRAEQYELGSSRSRSVRSRLLSLFGHSQLVTGIANESDKTLWPSLRLPTTAAHTANG